jgi:hypothetical protein
MYDNQNHILGDAPGWLQTLLRVRTPLELRDKIRLMSDSPKLWLQVVEAQRQHFWGAVTEKSYLRRIENRLGLS